MQNKSINLNGIKRALKGGQRFGRQVISPSVQISCTTIHQDGCLLTTCFGQQ